MEAKVLCAVGKKILFGEIRNVKHICNDTGKINSMVISERGRLILKVKSFSFTLFLLFALLQMAPFTPPLPTSTQPPCPLPSGDYHTVVCVYESCICVL